MTAASLAALARTLAAAPMTPADRDALARRLDAHACAWQRETTALNEVVAGAREQATLAGCAPDAASRHLRGLRNDVVGLVRPGATPDDLRGLAERLNTAIDLVRMVETTNLELRRELLAEAEVQARAICRPAPPGRTLTQPEELATRAAVAERIAALAADVGTRGRMGRGAS